MKYSVIIPAYQCGETIADTVRSVLNANLPDAEIVIVDDGSTDNTAAVCRELCALFPEVRYFRQQNSGVSAARNRGIESARGDFVLFVDSDDTLVPFDTRQLETALADDVDMLIFGMEFLYFKERSCVRKEVYTCDVPMTLTHRDIGPRFEDLFYRNYFSSACNKWIRRSVLMEHGIRFDPRLINYEDLEFCIRTMAYCRRIAAVPDIHYTYYLVHGQDRTIQRVKRIPDIIAAVDPIADAMFLLNDRIRQAAGADCEPLIKVLLQVYFEMFICKMKTAALSQVRLQCRSFRESRNIERCGGQVTQLPQREQMLREWICNEDHVRIWLYFRYRNLRNGTVRRIKSLLGKY